MALQCSLPLRRCLTANPANGCGPPGVSWGIGQSFSYTRRSKQQATRRALQFCQFLGFGLVGLAAFGVAGGAAGFAAVLIGVGVLRIQADGFV